MRTLLPERFATGLLLAVGLLLTGGNVDATNEIAAAEGVSCTTCHDKPGSKLYTDKGKYYETMGTLEGYDEIITSFRACTSCHVRKPGSPKLTAKGRRFARVIRDMEELKRWVLPRHPTKIPEDGEEPPGPDEDAGTDKPQP